MALSLRYGNWTGPEFSAGHDSPSFVALTASDLAVPGVDLFDNNVSKPHDIAFDNAQQTLASQWNSANSAQRLTLLVNYFQAIDSSDLTFIGAVPQNPSSSTWGGLLELFAVPTFLVQIADDETIVARLNTDPSYAASMTSLSFADLKTRLTSDIDLASDAAVYWLALFNNDNTAAILAATTSLYDLVQAVRHGDSFDDDVATLLGTGQGSLANVVDPILQLLGDRSGAIHQLQWISKSTGAPQANGDSEVPSISSDGRYVAFKSYAGNLVAGDTNGSPDIFVHDRQNDTITKVSVGLGGAQANGGSDNPSISQDGRFVAFESGATNLVSGDTGGWTEIFIYDRTTGTTKRLTTGLNVQGVTDHEPNWPSAHPSVESDSSGHFKVAFMSEAGNLVTGDARNVSKIYVYDSTTQAVTKITNGLGGAVPNGFSDFPSISATGLVAYQSDASNLVSGDTNGAGNIFLFNNGVTTKISFGLGGIAANGASSHPSISSDGNFVAFESMASNLVAGDTNNVSDIFVYDRAKGTIERVSVGTDGAQSNNSSYDASISGDGRLVTFWSSASDLVGEQVNPLGQLYVYDRQLHQTRIVSVSAVGRDSNDFDLVHPVISSDGTTVAFESAASDLYSGATGHSNIFETDALNFFNSGGPQNDTILSALGNDVLDGGGGNNTVSYAKILTAVTVSLAITTAQNTGGGGTDTLTNFQNVIGGASADHLTGDQNANKFTGGAGNDTIDGGAGFDTAIFAGNRSAYTITHSGSTFIVSGPDGTDTLSNIEKLEFSDVTMTLPLRDDFNGDDKADILWRTDGGTLAIWAIDGTRDKFNGFVNNGTAAVGAPGPDWHIVDTADFDSDGKGDILWRTDSGSLAIWEMDGTRIKLNGFVNNGTAAVGAPAPDWHIERLGDYDGDGKGDILWRTDSGSLAIWEMDGTRIKFNGFVNNGTAAVGAPGPDWHIAGAADFDGDAKGDILWRTDSGSLAIWEMDGARIKFNGFVNNGTAAVGAPGPDWHIADTADFDGDGKNDILWRTDSGSLAIWEMDGTRVKFSGFVNNGTAAVGAPGPDWHIERLGDYDGDGKNDVLWRTDSGSLAIWEMDGTRVKFPGYVNDGTAAVGAPGPDWHIVKPDYDMV